MADHTLFWTGIALILMTLALTAYVFGRRIFDRFNSVDRVGEAANPDEVRRQNPPD
jgi:hypothetical protein